MMYTEASQGVKKTALRNDQREKRGEFYSETEAHLPPFIMRVVSFNKVLSSQEDLLIIITREESKTIIIR